MATRTPEENLELKQREVVATQQLLDLERQRLRDATSLGLTLEEQRESYKKQLEQEEKIVSAKNSALRYQTEILAKAEGELQAARENSAISAQDLQRLEEKVRLQREIVQEQHTLNSELERDVELRKRANTQVDKLRQKTEGLITTLTGVDAAWKDTFVGSLMVATQEMGSFRAATGQAFNAAMEATSAGNIVGSAMMKIQEATIGMVYSLDEATVAFRKATGAGLEYNSRIMTVFESNRRFGISLTDSAQSFQALYTNMSAFSGYGAAFQGDLASVGAMLGKLGIDAQTFSGNMDVMTKSFGMSASQARQFSMDFAQLGSTIGLPPEELARQLNALTPRMAMFARTATTELRKLAAQSKSTGIEMQRLVGIAQGFDTFDDAAEKVGSLNALLGGPYLNVMQMMMATDTERISLMRRAISTTGQLGDIMTGTGAKARFLRKALADVGGFAGDVDAMMRILGNDLNEFSGDAMNATGSLGSLQQKASDNTTVMEKLANLLSYFAAQVVNLLELLRPLIDNVTGFADAMGSMFIPAVIGGAVAIRSIMGALTGFVGTVFRGATGLSSLGSGAATASTATGTLGTAATVAAIPLLAFGAAVALIGGGIWAAGKGIANMASGFKMMSDIDVSGLAMSTIKMADSVRELGSVSGRASSGMGKLLSALNSRGGDMREASMSMANFSSQISNMSFALNNFSAAKADLLNSTFANLSNTLSTGTLEESTRNLYNMASAAERVAEAIDKIDPSKANVMAQIAGGIKATVESAVDLSAAPEAVRATQRIAAAAASYAAAINDSRNLKDPLKDLIDTIRTSVTGGETYEGGGGRGRGAGGPTTVVLKIGKERFASAVINVMENSVFNLKT